MHTKQEVFDKSYLGILAQGEPGLIFRGCPTSNFFVIPTLRNSAGKCCAIGQLVPADEYKPEIELMDLRHLVKRVSGIPNTISLCFLDHIRRAHDDSAIEFPTDKAKFLIKFKEEMRIVAHKAGLKIPNNLGGI